MSLWAPDKEIEVVCVCEGEGEREREEARLKVTRTGKGQTSSVSGLFVFFSLALETFLRLLLHENRFQTNFAHCICTCDCIQCILSEKLYI